MTTIFFSLDRQENKASVQTIRNVRQRLSKNGIANVLVIGCFEGVPERTIKAEVTSNEQLLIIKSIARMFNQDSILQVFNNGESILTDLSNDSIVHVGLFREINKNIASTLKAWTFNPQVNKFYACI